MHLCARQLGHASQQGAYQRREVGRPDTGWIPGNISCPACPVCCLLWMCVCLLHTGGVAAACCCCPVLLLLPAACACCCRLACWQVCQVSRGMGRGGDLGVSQRCSSRKSRIWVLLFVVVVLLCCTCTTPCSMNLSTTLMRVWFFEHDLYACTTPCSMNSSTTLMRAWFFEHNLYAL